MNQINPKEIQTHEVFKNLFPINSQLLTKIEESMKTSHYHYDPSQPIIMATWKGQAEPVLIDGHTRVQASINAGLKQVPVCTHEFDTEEEALEHSIRLQSNRRNMTDAEIAACVLALDKKKPRGGDRRSEEAKSKASGAAIENASAKSAKETADLLGVSTTKVERVRNVLSNGDPETIETFKNGEMSMNQAYQETKKKPKKNKPKRNSTNASEKATNEGQELEQADEAADAAKEPTVIAPVFLSIEHFGALRKLGGSIEDHVAKAIERYLEAFREQHEDSSPESGEESNEDKCLNEQDNGGCPKYAADSGDEEKNKDEQDDDEEWFDPANYEND